MAYRRVAAAIKTDDGHIMGLVGPAFSFRSAEFVILDIEEGVHSYYVNEAGFELEVRVVQEGGRKVLRTRQDETVPVSLEDLPERW
jgi:hypothetical protein